MPTKTTFRQRLTVFMLFWDVLYSSQVELLSEHNVMKAVRFILNVSSRTREAIPVMSW